MAKKISAAVLSAAILLAMAGCFGAANQNQDDKQKSEPPIAPEGKTAEAETRPLSASAEKLSDQGDNTTGSAESDYSEKYIIKRTKKPENLEADSKIKLIAGKIGKGKWQNKIKVWDNYGEINTRANVIAEYEPETEVKYLGEKIEHNGWTYFLVEVKKDGAQGWVNNIFVEVETIEEYAE